MKLNLGCGGDIKAGYMNVDMREVPGVDLVCDVRHLDVRDGEAEEILAYNLLEHFGFRETQQVLREWWRVLKYGGTLKLIVPNLRVLVKAYNSKKLTAVVTDKWPFDNINYWLFGGQEYPENTHKTCFDEDSLRQALEKAGFEVVEITTDGGSNLVAEARKV